MNIFKSVHGSQEPESIQQNILSWGTSHTGLGPGTGEIENPVGKELISAARQAQLIELSQT